MSELLAISAALEVAQLIGIFSNTTRAIGPIIPGIVIEEDHEDTLTITDHPVEQGASITDHAFKNPAQLTINCLWSNTQASLLDLSESYSQTIYQQLLSLQSGRTLITIVTGKRLYPNMLIESISTQTTKNSAYSLPVQLQCREIILVATSSATLPPADQHIDPQQTAPTINSGQQALQGGGNQSFLLSAQQAAAKSLAALGVTLP